jgi:hypothetical protein
VRAGLEAVYLDLAYLNKVDKCGHFAAWEGIHGSRCSVAVLAFFGTTSRCTG